MRGIHTRTQPQPPAPAAPLALPGGGPAPHLAPGWTFPPSFLPFLSFLPSFLPSLPGRRDGQTYPVRAAEAAAPSPSLARCEVSAAPPLAASQGDTERHLLRAAPKYSYSSSSFFPSSSSSTPPAVRGRGGAGGGCSRVRLSLAQRPRRCWRCWPLQALQPGCSPRFCPAFIPWRRPPSSPRLALPKAACPRLMLEGGIQDRDTHHPRPGQQRFGGLRMPLFLWWQKPVE